MQQSRQLIISITLQERHHNAHHIYNNIQKKKLYIIQDVPYITLGYNAQSQPSTQLSTQDITVSH